MDNPQDRLDARELVTAEDMNAVGENLAALKYPPIVVGTTTEDIVIPSGPDFVDVDAVNLNLALVTFGGNVMVSFHGRMSAAHFCVVDVEVDENRIGDATYGIAGDESGGLSSTIFVSFSRLVQSLGPGSHNFKLQVKAEHGTTLRPGLQFWVREL